MKLINYRIGMGAFNTNFIFNNFKNFDHHKMIILLHNPKANLYGYISIHRGNTVKPAFGATRIWPYGSEVEALEDSLRLAKLMSYKAAMAGLQYGGAKAALIGTNIKNRKQLLESYCHSLNYLNGHFITGADVGINGHDLKIMATESPFIVGLKADPVKFTALGVYYSIQVCLREIFGSENLEGKTYAIQGLGKTGLALLDLIYKKASKIYVADINLSVVEKTKKLYPRIIVVPIKEINSQKVDVFCPCSLGDEITYKNIDLINCKIIVGSANNQLEDSSLGEILNKKGILYVPDYVVNAGGLITVVDEYENKDFSEDRLMKKVLNIKNTLQKIISKSKSENKATNIVSDRMAEKIFNKIN